MRMPLAGTGLLLFLPSLVHAEGLFLGTDPQATELGGVRNLRPTVSQCGFDARLRAGTRSLTLVSGCAVQHNLPSGRHAGLVAASLLVQYGKFTADGDEWGLEAGGYHLQAKQDTVLACSGSGFHRRYFAIEPRRTVYWTLGLGVVHLRQLLPELGTHTNFTEFAGLGAKWGCGRRGAWGLEYRFQHVSNAGRKYPNIGINASALIFGYTWYW